MNVQDGFIDRAVSLLLLPLVSALTAAELAVQTPPVNFLSISDPRWGLFYRRLTNAIDAD